MDGRKEAAMRKRIVGWLVTALLAGAGWVAAGQAQQQSQAPPPPAKPEAQSQAKPVSKEESVAEAARKAKAEKTKAKPKKVYTEEDLSGLQGKGISVVGQESAADTKEEKGEGAEPESPGAGKPAKDEAYWRGRAAKLRDQIAAVDREIEKVKKEIEKSGSGGFDPSTGLRQNVIYVEDRNARLKQLEKKKDDLVKQMDALQEEARKAGVDPGWLP
jgi:hypothetical protein